MNRSSIFRSQFWCGLVTTVLLLGAFTVEIAEGRTSGRSNVAYFAGGCFWCTEEIFQQAAGVKDVVSGYMNGAETIKISFDPARTDFNNLLDLFWRAHDPTDPDGQGPDRGKKYRSAIFFVDEEQHAAAEASKKKQTATGKYPRPIATEIAPAGRFARADEHHQNFCRKNPKNPYIQEWLVPKLKKLGLKQP